MLIESRLQQPYCVIATTSERGGLTLQATGATKQVSGELLTLQCEQRAVSSETELAERCTQSKDYFQLQNQLFPGFTHTHTHTHTHTLCSFANYIAIYIFVGLHIVCFIIIIIFYTVLINHYGYQYVHV